MYWNKPTSIFIVDITSDIFSSYVSSLTEMFPSVYEW